MPEKRPVVASYCSTFLKPEMYHIYRQVAGLRNVDTFVITKARKNAKQFPFPDVRLHKKGRVNFLKRFWLKYIRKAPPIIYRGEYQALEKVLEQKHVDMMHVYFGHTGVHLLPFIERWPKPTVVSFHGMDVQTRDHQPEYIDNLRALLKAAPLVMVRSESLKQRLVSIGCREDKIRMNRTSIPTGNFPFMIRNVPSDGAWKLVQACRLIEKKGLDNTLRVFSVFLKGFPKATLTIAGDGPLEQDLWKLAEDLEIRNQVRFTGFLTGDDLRDLYIDSHIFIHPSRITEDQNQEGVPNSMLEAMSTGLPVLATVHGGIPEVIEHGITGFLSPENDERALFDNLMAMVNHPRRWQDMGNEAAEVVRERFDLQRGIMNLESVYLEALQKWELMG